MTYKLISEDTVRSILLQRVGLRYTVGGSEREFYTAGKVSVVTLNESRDVLTILLENDTEAYIFNGFHMKLQSIDILESDGGVWEVLEDETEEEKENPEPFTELGADGEVKNLFYPPVNVNIESLDEQKIAESVASAVFWKLLDRANEK